MTTADPMHPNAPTPPPMPGDRGHWAKGLGFGILCIALVFPLAFIVGVVAAQFQPEGVYLGLMALAVFGLCQWLFVVPLALYLRYRGKTDTAMGLWITAGVALLLNGACFGLIAL